MICIRLSEGDAYMYVFPSDIKCVADLAGRTCVTLRCGTCYMVKNSTQSILSRLR